MNEQYVFFKHNGSLKKVDIDEIVAISVTDKNYIKFMLLDERTYIVRSPLYAALKLLPPNQFLRVHNSHAVSIRFINKIQKTSLLFNGNETEITVSKRYFNELKNQITILDVEIPKKKNKIDTTDKIPSTNKKQ